MNWVLLNGQIVPPEQAVVSVFDRGFLYGDSLFETVLVTRGRPFLWEQHLARLGAGTEFLNLKSPWTTAQLTDMAARLIAVNQANTAVLRLTLSRGPGPRGYSPRLAGPPTLVMSLETARLPAPGQPSGWTLHEFKTRANGWPSLARHKTGNKLLQILARAEAENHHADEALLTDEKGLALESATANLFAIQKNVLLTPPLEAGVLPGLTRALVLRLASELGLDSREADLPIAGLGDMEGIFLTLSTLGIVEGLALNGHPLPRSPLTRRLHQAFWAAALREA